MTMWTYHFKIDAVAADKTIKELWEAWYLPQRIRGALRIHRTYQVNGQYVPTNYLLKQDDDLKIDFLADFFRTSDSQYQPNTACTVPIIFENDDLVIVDKPAGMKMHPHSPTEQDTLLHYLAGYFKVQQTTSAGTVARPYMIHRLDRETSGLVIVAKNPVVVPIMNRLLAEKKIQRTYLAWVTGSVPARSGVMNEPIGIDEIDERKRAVNGLAAQPAITNWYRVHAVYQNTLLRLKLDTGRMHQIRVHLAFHGHPIVGDSLYGDENVYPRMLLHAMSIGMIMPFSQQTHFVMGTLPKDFPNQLKL